MKTRLLGALVGLAISFALPTFGQQKEPTLSEQEQAEKTAVDHALSAESDAFGRGDVSAIGQHCNVPFAVISPQGVKVLPTMSEIEAFFGEVIRDLRARGYAYSTRSELHVKLLDQTRALASAVFVRHKTDGSERETIGATYVLCKTEGEWKISLVMGHPPANVIRAD